MWDWTQWRLAMKPAEMLMQHWHQIGWLEDCAFFFWWLVPTWLERIGYMIVQGSKTSKKRLCRAPPPFQMTRRHPCLCLPPTCLRVWWIHAVYWIWQQKQAKRLWVCKGIRRPAFHWMTETQLRLGTNCTCFTTCVVVPHTFTIRSRLVLAPCPPVLTPCVFPPVGAGVLHDSGIWVSDLFAGCGPSLIVTRCEINGCDAWTTQLIMPRLGHVAKRGSPIICHLLLGTSRFWLVVVVAAVVVAVAVAVAVVVVVVVVVAVNIWTSKKAQTFDLDMCFAPQRRALFRHPNFQKWSDVGVFCAFWIGNVLRATTACTFSTSELPKVVCQWCVLYILTRKCASCHNGVHFFISHLASWLRTRRFSEVTFRPFGATNQLKNTMNRDFPTFSRTCILFLLTFSISYLLTSGLLLADSSHLCFSISAYCRKFDF